MKPGKGKSKGSAFERLISHKLSLWLTGQDKEYYFYRSPSSGAVATMNEQNGEITGDIIAIKPEARVLTSKFSIECKDGYPDADFMKLFKNNKNDTIQDFWAQCIKDARTADKQGMLIFRKKGMPILVGIEDDTSLSKLMKTNIKQHVILSYDDELPSIVFFEFDMFLEKLDLLQCVKNQQDR